ncbi:alpha/beta hydrolase [Streptomyces gamaensis]|uniref:Alpha/beta hydrolase n=1 Tax=Streptomyces gamaensis TaxID=1763542 RepID=A0ABW0YV78_9ACTN
MSYAFDPELAAFARTLPRASMADLRQAREAHDAQVAQLPRPVPSVPLDIRDTTVPGPPGAPDVPVRVYAPAERALGLPGVVYLHGGGFTMGSLDFAHAESLNIAAEVGAVVVSVDYRLAPEHPFPAGIDDCYAALEWTADRADELGIDPGRLAVAGQSSGAGFSAAVALLARDRGGPQLCFQYLGIPLLDDRLTTPSSRTFTDTPATNRPSLEYAWDYYLGPGRRGTADVSPYAAPARAEDLSGLPPAYIYVCEFDPLRDEGLIHGQRLIQAGVPTELHHFPGTFHGSTMFADAGISRRMTAESLDALRRGLHAAGRP